MIADALVKFYIPAITFNLGFDIINNVLLGFNTNWVWTFGKVYSGRNAESDSIKVVDGECLLNGGALPTDLLGYYYLKGE